MSISDHFSVPYIGLKDGIHSFVFDAGNDFFAKFEHSPVTEGSFVIRLDIDKRPGLSDLTFNISGHFATTCDRCLSDISLKTKGDYHLLLKVSDITSDDDEVIFISADEATLRLDQVIYEFICISLPLINVYDCENEIPRPCNDEVLNKLTTSSEEPDTNENNIWGSLKGLNLDSN